jgi:hypothetical protein
MARVRLVDVTAMKLALAVLVLAALMALPAGAGASGMRYCDPPGAAGQFVKASSGATCRTARAVAGAMLSARCIGRVSCSALGFRCVSVWDGDRSRPFSYSHHGECRSARGARIVFDAG